MNVDTLKEYLVKIGWDVNEIGFNKASGKINFFKMGIENAAVGMASKFLKSSDFIISGITKVSESMIDLMETTASADLETERFARKFWTTEKNARSLSVALDSLGMEYDDLFYATEEQYKRFQQLNQFGKSLEAPPALDDTLVKIRDIQFEFSKFKMILSYGSRWVVYWIGQFLGGDLDKIQKKLSDLNTFIIRNLPSITEKIAKFFTIFYKLAKAGYTVTEALSKSVYRFFRDMPHSAQVGLAGLSAAVMLFMSGPMGLLIAGLTYLLLLIDDYTTWAEGGKSYYGDKWKKVKDVLDEINSGPMSELKKNLYDIFTNIGKIFKQITGNQDNLSVLKVVLTGISKVLGLISDSLEFINDTIDALNGKISDIKDNSWMGKLLNKFPGLSDWFEEFGIDMKNAGNDIKSWLFGGDSIKGSDNYYDFWKKYYGYEANGTAARTYSGSTNNNTTKTVSVKNDIKVYGSPGGSANDTANATAQKIGSNRYWNQVVQV